MTKYVYSNEAVTLPSGAAFRNARMFEHVEPDATAVTILGDWPKVEAAYKAAGVPIVPLDGGSVALEPAQSEAIDAPEPLEDETDETEEGDEDED